MDWLRSRWDWIVRNKILTCVINWLLVFGVVMVCWHWGWIVTESGSTILRNLGLVARRPHCDRDSCLAWCCGRSPSGGFQTPGPVLPGASEGCPRPS